MRAIFEEGTELIVDNEEVPFPNGYTDVASTVSRRGETVTVSLHFTANARAPWAEKSKYVLGALTTEGGKTYRLIKLEEAAEKEKPTTSPTFWQEIANPLLLCTLPVPFRPSVEVPALKSGTATVKIGTDGTVKLSVAEANDALVVYQAAGISP